MESKRRYLAMRERVGKGSRGRSRTGAPLW
jgi:hypothetical protein